MTLNNQSKKFFAFGTLFMAITIAIGAFGAHGLKSMVSNEMLVIYHTGVEYQFYNTLGLLALSIMINFKENIRKIVISLWLIIIGMLIFSFSLYLLVILNLPILGAITPIGGTLLIIAWLLATYSILKDK